MALANVVLGHSPCGNLEPCSGFSFWTLGSRQETEFAHHSSRRFTTPALGARGTRKPRETFLQVGRLESLVWRDLGPPERVLPTSGGKLPPSVSGGGPFQVGSDPVPGEDFSLLAHDGGWVVHPDSQLGLPFVWAEGSFRSSRKWLGCCGDIAGVVLVILTWSIDPAYVAAPSGFIAVF